MTIDHFLFNNVSATIKTGEMHRKVKYWRRFSKQICARETADTNKNHNKRRKIKELLSISMRKISGHLRH